MVSIPPSATVGDIWERVKDWSAEDRRTLATKIIASLAGDSASGEPPTKPSSLTDLIGAWAAPNPPTDAEVRQIIEDAIIQKYGS
jgi:hypothetical protein